MSIEDILLDYKFPAYGFCGGALKIGNYGESYKAMDVTYLRLSKGFKFESIILQQGKITLSPILSNLPVLKSTLKQLNPNIEVADNTENPENIKRTKLEIVLGFIVFAVLLVVYFLLYFKG